MKRLLLLLSLLMFPVIVNATTVTGTVTDANGNVYANGTVSAFLSAPSGVTPTVGGVPVNPALGPFPMTSAGTFSVTVTDNNTITPVKTQWSFQFCAMSVFITPAGPPPIQVCFTIQPITITGTIQSITSSLGTVPLIGPALCTSGCGGGGGGSPPAGNVGDMQIKATPTTFGAGGINDNLTNLLFNKNILNTNHANVFLTPVIGDGIQYVSSSGNDSNDGLSWGTAKATCPAAVVAMPNSGGGIMLGSGTFSGTCILTKPILIKCQSLATELTIPGASNNSVVIISSNNSGVSGCTIDGNNTNQSSINSSGVSITGNLSSVFVTGNLIQNTFGSGISDAGNAYYHVISGNQFFNNNQPAVNNYALDYEEPTNGTGTFLFFNENFFDENNSGCIKVEETDTGGLPATLTDTISINGNHCVSAASTSYITNGISVLTNDSAGSGLNGAISNLTIANNIIDEQTTAAGSQSTGISVSGSVINTVISNNSITSALLHCMFISNTNLTFGDGVGYNINANTCTDAHSVAIGGTSQMNLNFTGNSIKDSTDSGTELTINASAGSLSNINIADNNFYQSGFPNVPNQIAIALNGTVDSSINGNTIYNNTGAGQASPAIELQSSSNNLISSNNIRGYTGSGSGAVGIYIFSGTSNTLGINNFDSVTTPYLDSGTTTVLEDVKPTNFPSSGQACIAVSNRSCTWQAIGGGGGTPGGIDKSIQYNNAGAFGGVPSPVLPGNYIVNYNVPSTSAVTPTITLPGVPIVTPSSPYSPSAGCPNDRAVFYNVTGGSTFTFNLPLITGNCSFNLPFDLYNGDSGLVTFNASGSDTVNGSGAGGSDTLFAKWAIFEYQAPTISPGSWIGFKIPTLAAWTDCHGANQGSNFNATTGAFGCVTFSAGGTVTTSGSPVNLELTCFSAATVITNCNLSQDVVTSNTAVATVVQIENGTIPTSAPVGGWNSSKQPVASTGHNLAQIAHCSDTSGSATAQSCTTSPTFAPAKGDWIVYDTTTTSGATLTLNVNSSSAATVGVYNGVRAASTGDIQSGEPVLMTFDGTNWLAQASGVDPLGNKNTCNPTVFGTLTDAAPVVWNANSIKCYNESLTFTVHGGSRTINLSNLVNGGSYVLKLIQDGTGGENLTGGTGCTWKQLGGGGSTFTLTGTASALDILTFTYDGTNCIANLGKAYN
jgi:hypothetical protein